jgi:hypothetical protein
MHTTEIEGYGVSEDDTRYPSIEILSFRTADESTYSQWIVSADGHRAVRLVISGVGGCEQNFYHRCRRVQWHDVLGRQLHDAR